MYSLKTSSVLASALLLFLGTSTWATDVTLTARLEGLVKDPKVAAVLYDDIVKADRTGIIAMMDEDATYAQIKYRHFVEELQHRVSRLQNVDRKHHPPTVGELGLAMLVPLDPIPFDEDISHSLLLL